MSSLLASREWFHETIGINKASAETTIDGRPGRAWFVTKKVRASKSGSSHLPWSVRVSVKAHEGITRLETVETHFFKSFQEIREYASEAVKDGFTTDKGSK